MIDGWAMDGLLALGGTGHWEVMGEGYWDGTLRRKVRGEGGDWDARCTEIAMRGITANTNANVNDNVNVNGESTTLYCTVVYAAAV